MLCVFEFRTFFFYVQYKNMLVHSPPPGGADAMTREAAASLAPTFPRHWEGVAIINTGSDEGAYESRSAVSVSDG